MKRQAFALILTLFSLTTMAQDGTEAAFRLWATTPPRGWNSWDCYYSSVNEAVVRQNAEYMRDHLLDYGWEYVVVDIRWYCNHPSLGGGNYNQNGTQDYVLDDFGRYLPSPTRFPSAMQNGVNEGFRKLADDIHAMGLKFGIHIMRGIPVSVAQNPSKYSLLGAEDNSTATARRKNWGKVYSGTTSPCTWLKDNALVRNTDEGQLYYNSIVNLYASWGVDFIKVDDMSRPFYEDEIRMLRRAIDQCGRPIVLSLSPGKTQYQYVEQCHELANQWRMMDDLWDNWGAVSAVFAEADAWAPHHQVGNYADCDMLPLGQIAMTLIDPGYTGAQGGRWTRLTKDEQRTMMTLWGICHSPLMMGGEMTRNDDWTLSLLTNRNMLDMNAYGQDARQVSKSRGRYVWTSINPTDGSRYLALFSTDGDEEWLYANKALYVSETVAYTTDGHKVDVDVALPEGTRTLALVVDDGGDNWNYDHGDWINPTLISSNGYEVPLTGKMITKRYTNSYYNVIRENQNVLGTGKMRVMGVQYDRGFSMDANAMMLFDIPDSIVSFRGIGAADDTGITQQGATTSIRFMVFAGDARTSLAESPVNALAYSGLLRRTGRKSALLEADVTGASQLKIFVSNFQDGFSYDRADLVNPVLIDNEGNETRLTTLTPASYVSQWGELQTNKNVEGGPLVIDGTTYAEGLGMNAEAALIYELPEGHHYHTFRALCGYDSSCDADNTATTGTTLEFLVFTDSEPTAFSVDLTQFGYASDQSIQVLDCWADTLLSTPVTSVLTAEVNDHGTRLFRLSPERTGGNSISLTLQGDTLLLAQVTGDIDNQSYVTFTVDGHILGISRPDASTRQATYLLSPTQSGRHTFQALYSGTAHTANCSSNPVTADLTDAIRTLPSHPAASSAICYDLSGRRVEKPAKGIYIQQGEKRLRK